MAYKDKQTQKEYYLKNKEKIKTYQREYRENNPEVIKALRKKYLKENREKIKEAKIKYYQENKERLKEVSRKYRKENPEKINKNVRDRYKTDIHFQLKNRMRNAINVKLRNHGGKKDRSIKECLPYTIQELKEHLENKFLKGMSWENRSDWHIDHIIPDSSFDYTSTTDEEFQKCWGLENLQPLWAMDNFLKGSKLK